MLFKNQGINITSRWDTHNDAIHESAVKCLTSGSATCSVEAEPELQAYKDDCQSINEANYFEVPSFRLSCARGESTISVDITVKDIGFCFAQTEACEGLENNTEAIQNHIIDIFALKNLTNCTVMDPQVSHSIESFLTITKYLTHFFSQSDGTVATPLPVSDVDGQLTTKDPEAEEPSHAMITTAGGIVVLASLAFLFIF